MTADSNTLGQALLQLFGHLPRERKRRFGGLLAIMLIGAVAELVALGSLLPFLTLLANPERVQAIEPLAGIFDFLGAQSPREMLILATSVFATAAIASGAVRLYVTWASQSYVYDVGHDLSVEIHGRMLHQPYSYHISQNSSYVIAALTKIQILVFSVLLPLMTGLSATIISIFIVAVLIYVDPLVAGVSAAGFGLVYGMVSAFTQGRLSRNSEIINTTTATRIQAIQEGLGGIRDIILDQSQRFYIDRFKAIDRRFGTAHAINIFIGAAPRFVIEAVGMVLIAFAALLLSNRAGGLAASLPILGVLALGAQRLLPLLQQVYHGWAQVRGSGAIVIDIVGMLALPSEEQSDLTSVEPLAFNEAIRFDNVSFVYGGSEETVLRAIELSIPKGSRVALIGKTGSGKSTLIDLLMGLLEPSSGTVRVDGVALSRVERRAWQRQIAHVPQTIFLADATIERNIAFGVDDHLIDRQRVELAASQAQLDDFIKDLPDGYQTSVGERGVRLSGGQRQRLGIARALYKSTSVLILDEATSALDDVTEAALMRSLEGLDNRLTVVMIAHRLSTVANCDIVIRMNEGRIVDSGSYEDVIGAKPKSSKKTEPN